MAVLNLGKDHQSALHQEISGIGVIMTCFIL